MEKTTNSQKDTVVIYTELGKALADKGELEEAIENFQKAIDLEPSAYSYNMLGYALFKHDKLEVARHL